MPLLQPPPQFIDVPVRPVCIGGILFQRSTRFVSVFPQQHPDTGEMQVALTVQVRHFLTNADESVGESAAELMPPYELTYSANNTEVVDLKTGETVRTRTVETRAEWLAVNQADERALMLRGDAYAAQMHGGPVDMVSPIRAAMLAADGPPYYRFGGRPALPENTKSSS